MELEDFTPISLSGSLYMLVAEVLTTRLTRVMNSLISIVVFTGRFIFIRVLRKGIN